MEARAVLFREPRQPFELVRLQVPPLQPTEIRARVLCCTLCGSDLHTHAGRRTVETPTVLGHEVVGRIEEFGSDASHSDFRGARLEVGSRISWSVTVSCGSCFYCKHELPQKCFSLKKYGHQNYQSHPAFFGGLADVVTLVPGTAIFRVPDELTNEVAAPANCATATAAAVLRAAGDIAGKTVLIFGAGMLGLTACAMAHTARAAHIIICDPDSDRRELARSFGATAVESAIVRELALAVEVATEDRGVDVALELAGVADAVSAGLKLTRVGGTLILAGTVSPTPSVALYPETVVRRMLTIRGVHNYAPRDLGAALDFLAGPGKAYPFAELVQQKFALDDVEQAFEFAHANRGGRVAVVP
jgi:putative phosphonate catabolism associated alcohol dehydrogenase